LQSSLPPLVPHRLGRRLFCFQHMVASPMFALLTTLKLSFSWTHPSSVISTPCLMSMVPFLGSCFAAGFSWGMLRPLLQPFSRLFFFLIGDIPATVPFNGLRQPPFVLFWPILDGLGWAPFNFFMFFPVTAVVNCDYLLWCPPSPCPPPYSLGHVKVRFVFFFRLIFNSLLP